MAKKTAYDELKEQISKKVKEAGSTRHSKSDLTAMTHTLLNTPEQEVSEYVNSDQPVIKKPVERYRESLKPVIEQFGVDKAELDRIQEVKFSKEHADAFMDLAETVQKDYMRAGRKLIFPINEKDETQMEISTVAKEKSVKKTMKPEKDEAGNNITVPTGKIKTVEAHTEIKASNKVPAWIQSEKPDPDYKG